MASTRASAIKGTGTAIKEEQDQVPAPKGYEEEDEEDTNAETVAIEVQRFMDKVLCERQAYVKRRMCTNKERLKGFTGNILRLDRERKSIWERTEKSNFFSLCIKSHQAFGVSNGSETSNGEKEGRLGTQESGGLEKPMAIIYGCQTGGKAAVRPVKLRKVENVPTYTAWIYLDRNQRMTEDQSVVGRRRIYYDSDGNETLIASDSEEEDPGDDDDKEEPKHDFSKGEDSLIWMTIRELGLKKVVLEELFDVLEIKPEEIEERYGILLKEHAKSERSGLPLASSVGTLSSGIASSLSRSIVPAVELAQSSVNETNGFMKATSNEIMMFNPGKEIMKEESAVQALLVSENKYALLDNQEDVKEEPKDLLAAMDSFDNLFCRRCLVFDCRLHGCSQAIVHPSEKQQAWTGTEEAMSTPCGENCYLLTDPDYVKRTSLRLEAPQRDVDGSDFELSESPEQDPATINTPENEEDALVIPAKTTRLSSRERSSSSETQAWAASTTLEPAAAEQVGRVTEKSVMALKEKKLEKRPSATRRSLSRRVKRQCPPRDVPSFLKPQLSQEESAISLDSESQDSPKEESPLLKEDESPHQEKASESNEAGQVKVPSKRPCTLNDDENERNDQGDDDTSREGEIADMNIALVPIPEVFSYKEGQDEAPDEAAKPEVGVGWSQLELGLYEKGLLIFGKNSCLIARNLLRGCKTCAEVAKYTLELDAAGLGGTRRSGGDNLDIEAASRERLYGARRKRNMRKLKYTFKSVVHPLIRKRLANGKDQPCRQYTPCNCLYSCGRQCPCLLNGTCCEKYCGCSKSCKNRFRGCHCAKSNCCSRQCPCFAAGRECDPDVCRNCWVGCGDGTFEGPPPRGDSSACLNMKLMLKQQQRVLLGKSDVAGWGAFLKNPVAKHEYLGEYTGELISHREADKRGKIYDRENSSFLFNLNDQYVLDACRKGDKLKFANHSPQPNCYAKVIMVSGDHRVGIFAKEKITAGEELFYDYRYEPDRAPPWAKKPDDPNHKRDDMPSTTGRAQKAAN
ncbi:hypothetical protein KC19_8G013400 [Ceratodon purpureus]|uniref:Uncharacterized protein n=1 Tax=Ceratodon purpureus TaxID=3225 RepID=A0A8T0GYM2_CERPU|nr:hypothetical protein KC19_8G013400 [Ceratodon purpureus]